MTADEFRAALAERFEDPDPDQAVLVDEACRVIDRVAELDAAIAEDGLTVRGARGDVRPHPLLEPQRKLRETLARLLRELGLRAEEESPRTRKARAAANARWAR